MKSFRVALGVCVCLLSSVACGGAADDNPLASGGSGGSSTSDGGSIQSDGGSSPGHGGNAPSSGGGSSQGGNSQGGNSQGGKNATGGSSSGGQSSTGSSSSRGGNGAGTGGTSSTGGTKSTGGTGGTQPPAAGYLHVEGSELRDDQGHRARFTGVNWFGFETSNKSPHGLWLRDYRSMLKQIKALGFNSVRIPWANVIMRPGAHAESLTNYGTDAYDGTDPVNAGFADKTPLEMLDLIVQASSELGLKLILDNHSRKNDGYMEEQVWYTDDCSEEQWIADWVALAERYRNNPTVAAFDLDNEPHGKATWAAGDPKTDWNAAAERCGNAIQKVNPDVLIIIEGVEKVGTDGYWWGSNLSGVEKNPIQLSIPKKLVYSAHEYGPEVFAQDWFTAASFPGNLPDQVWGPHFDFLMKQGKGHILLGEFGIKDPKAASGKAGVWFDTLLAYVGDTYSWTFWCWNPNSGDTEGILDYDWLTPKQWKIDALKPHMAPMIGG